jgi:hypothetical protein
MVLAYVCQYRKYFPNDSWEYIWSELPMCEGFCYIAGAECYDGWVQFGESEMVGGGYVGDEVRRMTKQKPG